MKVVSTRMAVVAAKKSDLFLAGLRALGAKKIGRYYYWKCPSGSVYILNQAAIIAAGAATLSGNGKNDWINEWESRFRLRKVHPAKSVSSRSGGYTERRKNVVHKM